MTVISLKRLIRMRFYIQIGKAKTTLEKILACGPLELIAIYILG